MAKTNSGLVEYVKAKVGCYYWYGTFGQLSSQKGLLAQKRKQYPAYYKATDFEDQVKNPKQVFDCAGLIKAYNWTTSLDDVKPKYDSKTDYGATAFYKNCTKKGTIKNFDKVAGRLVFKGTPSKMTHVGVYIGDNKIVEAKGHKYGVIISELDGTWSHWGQSNLFEDDTSTATPAPVQPEKPVTPPTPAPAEKVYTVRVNTVLNVRSGAGLNYKVVGKLKNGTKVTVYERSGSWGRIGDNRWVSMNYLK